jgi:hypothetical protein
MACGREERSDCCDSKTKSEQYGESIDESFEYTRNEEENDRTRDAGTEYGGAPYLFEPRTDYSVYWVSQGVSEKAEVKTVNLNLTDQEDVDRDRWRAGNNEWSVGIIIVYN